MLCGPHAHLSTWSWSGTPNTPSCPSVPFPPTVVLPFHTPLFPVIMIFIHDLNNTHSWREKGEIISTTYTLGGSRFWRMIQVSPNPVFPAHHSLINFSLSSHPMFVNLLFLWWLVLIITSSSRPIQPLTLGVIWYLVDLWQNTGLVTPRGRTTTSNTWLVW